MDALARDLRHAARALRKQPVFTAVAVFTLALGIGTNTALFTVLDSTLLRRLPYRDAGRLATLWVDFGEAGQSLPAISPLDFRDLQLMSQRFEAFAAGTGESANLVGEGDPEQVELGRVTHNFFPLLGVEPALGRGFAAEEDVVNGRRVILLSHGLWQRRYAGDPEVVGKAIQVDGTPMEVIGVMPAGFRLYLPSEASWLKDSDLWAPLQDPYTGIRNRTTLNALGRLKSGVTLEQAQEELSSIAAHLRAEHQVHALSDTRIRAVPLHSDIVKGVRPSLLLLSVAVALVLFIACGNVASLMLARAAGRQRELNLRAVLGAGRSRLARQVLVEATLIAIAGGALGLLLAAWGIRLLLVLQPSHLPRLDVGIDGAALAFSVMCSLGTVLLFGLAPAIRASRPRLDAALELGGRGVVGAAGSRLRRLVIVGEIAISLVLLIAGGLLVRSFEALRQVRPGFEADGVLTFRVSLPRARYPDYATRAAFYDRLEEQLVALPGVLSVGGVSQLPLTGGGSQAPYAYDDETAKKWESVTADARVVTPGYFAAVGTRLRAGRPFDDRDSLDGRLVVIVDETLARKAFPGQEAVGQQVQLPVFGPEGISRQWLEVVGVVEHVRLYDLARDVREQVYLPHRQRAPSRMDLAVRAAGDPNDLAGLVPLAVHGLDSDLPVQRLRPFAEYVTAARGQARFTLVLIGVFASIALLLALVGLFGLVHDGVSARTTELCVRRALGAQRSDILGLVVRYGMSLILGGVVLGLAGAFGASFVLSGLLYGVSATDPATFLGAPLLLFAVALGACLIPAQRASRVEPMAVLRGE